MNNEVKIRLSFTYFKRIIRSLSFMFVFSIIYVACLLFFSSMSTMSDSLWVLIAGILSIFVSIVLIALAGYGVVTVLLNNPYLMSRLFPDLKSITILSTKGYNVKLRLDFVRGKSLGGRLLWGLGDIPLSNPSAKAVASFKEQGYIYAKDKPFVFYPANKPAQYSLAKE